MKKTILFLSAFAFVISISACNNPPAEEETMEHEHAHSHEDEGELHSHDHEHEGDTTDHRHE